MANSLRNVSVAQLELAVAIKEKSERLEGELNGIFNQGDVSTTTG